MPVCEHGAAPATAAKPGGSAADMGYALGFQIGIRIRDEHRQLVTAIDYAALARGLGDAVTGGKPALKEADFRRALLELQAETGLTPCGSAHEQGTPSSAASAHRPVPARSAGVRLPASTPRT